MLYLIVFVFCVAVALGTGVLACISDFKGLTIPNLYPALVVGTFVPAAGVVYLSGSSIMGPPLMHLAVAGGVFFLTFILFAVKAFGGGDSKLLTAYALWAGPAGFVQLLFYMAVSGGLLGLVTILIMKKKPFKDPKEGSWIARVQAEESRVPYGIPIVIGAFVAFLQAGFFDPGDLGSFVRAATEDL